MEANILTIIEGILVPLGFQKTTENSNFIGEGCRDVGQVQILFYRLLKSDFYLEIQLTNYKGQTTIVNSNASTSTVAVNILILLLSNGVRTFGASKFIDDENSMRDNIEDILKIPTDKLKNASNPSAKCFGQNLVRDKILEYLQPKEVACLERVSTYFRYILLDPSVDLSFWHKHYLEEYSDNDLDQIRTYRTQYHEKKFHARDWLIFASRYSLNIPAFLPSPRRPIQPNPLQPNIPRNPFQPIIDPVQPFRPGIPFPPLEGDFNQPNWFPGARPIGDPLNLMPGRERRGDPDMPLGPFQQEFIGRRGGNRGGRSGGGGGFDFGGGGSFGGII